MGIMSVHSSSERKGKQRMKFLETPLNLSIFETTVQRDFSHAELTCLSVLSLLTKDLQIYELLKFFYEHIIFSVQLSDAFGGYLFQAVNT